ncbi:MAG: methyltransferase domain-containing protein [Candidatus Omnitrophota bacterium]
MNYSAKFKKLISDKEKVKQLLSGSHFLSTDFRSWENARKFISKSIHKDGRMLDIGCANGFLLLCLQEWSRHKLEPFGIDNRNEAIEACKNNFKAYKKRFAVRNVCEMSKLPSCFPKKFDMVFWCVWKDWYFKRDHETGALNDVLRLVAPGGRLILGFYDGEKRAIESIKRFKELGLRLARIIKNPTGIEMLAWVNVR